MLINQLSRIPEFSQLATGELRALAARSRILCLPKDRWVVRKGKDLSTHCYLLHGAIRTFHPNRRVRYSRFGQLHHFYPGCCAVRTQSACQILLIESARREFLLNGQHDLGSFIGSQEVWLADFLSTNMMQELDANQWRLLLQSFRPSVVRAGEVVVNVGDEASECFVVEAGHAVVHNDKQTLSHLNPGDFFGEDALILGSGRTASVTALENMVIHAIDIATFESLLLNNLIQPVSAYGDGKLLNLGQQTIPGALAFSINDFRRSIGKLDRRDNYYIAGGSERHRLLLAFLLVQRGVRAYPLLN